MSMFEFMKLSKKLDTILDSDVITNGTVKSIQRGTVSNKDTSNITIKINTVNPDKCIVILNSTRVVASSNSYGNPILVSISSNNFIVTRSSYLENSSVKAIYFSWQLVEFY